LDHGFYFFFFLSMYSLANSVRRALLFNPIRLASSNAFSNSHPSRRTLRIIQKAPTLFLFLRDRAQGQRRQRERTCHNKLSSVHWIVFSSEFAAHRNRVVSEFGAICSETTSDWEEPRESSDEMFS
jgi:hypothetical protein